VRSPISYVILAAVLALIAAGCSHKGTESSQAPAVEPAPTATVDLATAGSISGSVKLDGKRPALRPIDMSAEPACEKAHPKPVMPPEVVVGEGGALADVVVYVKGGHLEEYRFSTPAQPVELDQRGCMYEPHVLALMANQKLQVKNDDQTTHNVHALPTENPEWNESQPIGAEPFVERFAQPEMAIPIRCNVHPWMKAYVFVFPNPYYAVTASDGKFEIKNLPPGTYTLEAWQEKYGVEDQSVTIEPRGAKEVSFTFKSANAAAE
jgi:plastocyanin